jgi:septal ring-binding cell division protein DamX
MAREELRINIIIKGDHIFLGAQAADCDPKMTTLQGDLQAALARIPSFVEESNQQWDVSARNPKSSIPEPVAPSAPARTATTSTASKPAATKPNQPSFF